MSKYLHQIITEELGRKTIEKTDVPEFLKGNLRRGFGEREYQKRAFQYFINYWNENFDGKPPKKHLLFHMATGSGKTLIMAGLILYLYEKGYRNFLFFVNSTNIIEKTRDNFLNPVSSKYLFAETVSIGSKQIRIKEVDNFQAANGEDINIVFSTIQGLHSRLNTPKENSITYEDFEDGKIVLISDEAHHINAETKRGKKQEIISADFDNEEVVSWEQTVLKIFTAHSENVLLEFTATADLQDPNIAAKYKDKLLFDYPLSQFRIDKYSKEVKVTEMDLLPFDRALYAMILSQYRRKIFEKNGQHVKPVILFKSKTIKESEEFLKEFSERIKDLKVSDLEKIEKNALRNISTEKPQIDIFSETAPRLDKIFTKAFEFFKTQKITFENLILEFQEDFSEEKLISVNSKDESEQKQIAVNTLEDENNEYRAVFAVDKLNEGWDVLNLFDIVRLFNTRDSKAGKVGKTTMAEAQLIGRGARYFPFKITPEQDLYLRKYDEDLENELRVCEELYYHSAHNPLYIQELKRALIETGMLPKQSTEITISLKDSFKETELFQNGYIYLNEQEKYKREDVVSLEAGIRNAKHEVTLKTGRTQTTGAFNEKEQTTGLELKTVKFPIHDFGAHLIRKALNKLEFYHFNNLKTYFPHLKSIMEFIESNDYLGTVTVDILGLPEQVQNLSAKDKLEAVLKVLEDTAAYIISEKVDFKGTKVFKAKAFNKVFSNKTINVMINEGEQELGKPMNDRASKYYLDLNKKERDWYAFDENYGTSEEKHFVKYVDKIYDKLKAKYDEIYLVRNEHHFKIYTFDEGKPLQPDFVLFLKNNSSQKTFHYQVFIEPKGNHLLKTDEWKQNFLNTLKSEHKLEQISRSREYVIWGMPFYNNETEPMFDGAFEAAFLKEEGSVILETTEIAVEV
ncbi:MAG: DEAD/DEAH box helicase family protein [Bacteroidota bacterium]